MQRGAWITDSIELSAPIAEGAMGRVWVAFHHRLQIQVAVKFVSDKLADDRREAVARFEREAVVAAQIKSPHVVQTFDSGLTNDGVPYIVMELLRGESLGDRLRRTGRITLSEATVVVQHCGRGLSEAHALGIVHRDIKPDNIFLCPGEGGFSCKVLDFGIAKQTRLPAMGGLTTDGKLVGTPEYMSPEQVLEERAVDFRADLWSLAVVMYQALTGQLPFTGATLGQLCLNLVGTAPAKATSYRSDLPPRVDAWFGRALNRDPQMRFTSAAQMAESFATLDDDLAFHAVDVAENTERHLSSSHTLERMNTRKTSTVVTAAGLAAAVAVLGGGSWVATQPADEATILAQQALAPMVARAADRAVSAAAAPKPKVEVIDLDETTSPPAPTRGGAPMVRPAMKAPPTAPAAKAPEPPPPAPAPATPDRRRTRTPGNTGF